MQRDLSWDHRFLMATPTSDPQAMPTGENAVSYKALRFLYERYQTPHLFPPHHRGSTLLSLTITPTQVRTDSRSSSWTKLTPVQDHVILRYIYHYHHQRWLSREPIQSTGYSTRSVSTITYHSQPNGQPTHHGVPERASPRDAVLAFRFP